MDTERLRELLSPILPYIRSPWVMGMLVLFLAVYAVLGFSYFGKVSEQPDLRTTRDQWARIVARSSVEEDIREKEAELQALQESIPSADLTEIDVFQTMWDLADQVRLNPADVEPKLTGEVASQKVGNSAYRVLSFSMKVSGDVDQVRDFVQILDNGETPFTTLALDKTSFSLGEPSNATMDFKIYTRTAGE